MTKVLDVSYRDHVWQIPARCIAHNRAIYYAENDGDSTYNEEFEFAMEDDYELADWFQNNMNWSDVRDHAKLVRTAPVGEPDICSEDCKISIITIPAKS